MYCTECDYSVKWPSALRVHMKKKHSNEAKKEFLCELCEYKVPMQ